MPRNQVLGRAGERLGRFTLIRALRQLWSGDLWLATEACRDESVRCVALNILSRDLLDNDDACRRFFRDARWGRRLRHPNIVGIHALEVERPTQFLASEYVVGRSLSELVTAVRRSRAQIPAGAVARIGVEVCRALDAARGFHRALEPDKILISSTGEVKVLGFAHPATTAETEYMILGAPSYATPEYIQNRARDERTELFVLASILWELSTLDRPFERETAPETLLAIVQDRAHSLLEVRRDFPRTLDAIIARAHEKPPENRFANARDMQRALEDFLSRHDNPPDLSKLVHDELGDELAREDAERAALTKESPHSEGPETRAERTALEAAIVSSRGSPEAFLVYADYLQMHDDPRGELIVLDHALAKGAQLTGTRELKREFSIQRFDVSSMVRERQLLAKHSKELCEGLAWAGRSLLEAVWHLGFIDTAVIEVSADLDDAIDAISALADAPSGRFTRQVVLMIAPSAALDRALGLSQLACLRTLTLRASASHPALDLGSWRLAVALADLDPGVNLSFDLPFPRERLHELVAGTPLEKLLA